MTARAGLRAVGLLLGAIVLATAPLWLPVLVVIMGSRKKRKDHRRKEGGE